MKDAELVTFGGSGLDRAAHLRGDAAALSALKKSDAACWLVLWRGKVAVSKEPQGQLLRLPAAHPLLQNHPGPEIFLGLQAGKPVFARDISSWEPEFEATVEPQSFVDLSTQTHPDLAENETFSDLRALLSLIRRDDGELAVTARSVFSWHRSHRFCARCGQESQPGMAGWQRDCPQCDAHHFPRTDPVVIMLITRGNDLLIGRSPHWPEGMYSLLAGFVEPGETLEAAVRREVFEESGIRVGAVSYLASQPWPFPSSLMFGCIGEAKPGDITLDETELEEAFWISREEMAGVFSGTNPRISPPRSGSIAQFLMSKWLADCLD